MSNNILIRDFTKLDEGFNTCCDVVAESFGAEGKLVLLDNGNDPCFLTKDGFKISERVRFADKTMNFGSIQAIKGAMMTAMKSGDSTTTTMILQQGYVRGINREKFNKAVQRGVYKAVEETYVHLEALAQPTTKEDYLKIAKISCNNDEELASLIVEAFEMAGDAKIVDLTKNENSTQTKVFQHNGMVLDSGFASAFFINKQDNLTFSAENCPIILSATWGKDIALVNKIKAFYQTQKSTAPLLVVLERPSSEMTEFLIAMKKSHFNVCCVGLTAYTEYENQTLLSDLALFTQGEVYEPSVEDKLVVGVADKIVITSSTTTISVSEKSDKVLELLKSLEELEVKDNKILARIKRLNGLASLVEVGGFNLTDILERYDRAEDCISSIKTVSEEGWIPGGGSTLMYISTLLKSDLGNKSEQRGYDLVKAVLQEPFKRILFNSNKKDLYDTFEPSYGYGYNAIKDEFSNLIEDEVLDSKKSIRIAIESATETAIKHLNTSAVVHYPKEIS
jgi:chaperonin GroEL